MLLPETDAAGGVDRRRAARRGGPRRRRSSYRPRRRTRTVTSTVTVSIGIAVFPDHGGTGAGGARRRRRRALRGQGGRAGHVPAGRRPVAPCRDASPTWRPAVRTVAPPAARRAGHSRRDRPRRIVSRHVGHASDARDSARRTGRPGRQGGHPGRRSGHPFLPATKAVPKELLPVVDRPVLQYIVEEAAAAGISDVLLITGRGKTCMVDHFDRQPVPGVAAGGEGRPGAARRGPPHQRTGRDLHLPAGRAARPRATPSSYAESHVGDEPFAVLLGDEFVDESTSRCCRRCSTCRRAPAASCWPSSRSPRGDVTGTASPRSTPAEPELADVGPSVVRVTGLVEKPAPEEAPSNLAVVGRYVLPADDLRRDPADQAGQRRRDPADRRDGAAAGRGHAGARHRLPRHPLRHRHAAGLPAGRGAARRASATTSGRRSAPG